MTIGAAIPGPQQPFAAAGAAILGAINTQNAQNKAASTASSLYGKEGGLIDSLTGTPWLGPILSADKGAINTLKQETGGVANIGDLAKTLLGDDLSTALSAGLGQRASNIQNAIGDVSGMAGAASSAATGMGNPWANLGAGFANFPPLFGPGGLFAGKGSTGAPGGGDVLPPGATSGANAGGGLWTGGPVSATGGSY